VVTIIAVVVTIWIGELQKNIQVKSWRVLSVIASEYNARRCDY
jgi:hypothetical protein